MTDHDLAEFLGIAGDPRWPHAIARLTPQQRATYERLNEVYTAINLYESGLGPKPIGVIICGDHDTHR